MIEMIVTLITKTASASKANPKRAIFTTLMGFLSSHLSYVINHHKSCGEFMPLCPRMTVKVKENGT